MTLTRIKGDLFAVNKDYAFAHCISSDYAMGAGIAKAFTAIGTKDAILKVCGAPMINAEGHTDRWEGIGYCIPVTVDGRRIFNLVTKERYYNKPTLMTMKEALEQMRKHAMHANCTQIAMPLIGCGLDKLQWKDVELLIKTVFRNTDIDILVCSL